MVELGHYAKKQIFCQNQIIAWSHSSRFAMTCKLLEKYTTSNNTLLNYGCGDGTFLSMVSDLFLEAVGTDIAPNQIDDCRQRFSEIPQLSFCLLEELDLQYQSYFDIAVCMEVLEHCLETRVEEVIKILKKSVKKDGIIIISVPIEIGPSLLVKQITRKIAGWLRQGDYDKAIEHYTPSEFLQMLLATKTTVINRPVFGTENLYHGHKGFNWRSLRHKLASDLQIERTAFSPLGWLGGFFSSQVFLICRNK